MPPEPKGKLGTMTGYSFTTPVWSGGRWIVPEVTATAPTVNGPEGRPRMQDAPAGWDQVDWRAQEGQVRRLRQRIFKARVMAQRLQANKRAAAGRGELRTPLPVGYIHDDAGDIVTDPDAEVQAAIRDVFAAFAACGSAYGVVAAFAGRRFPLRAYGGAWAGQLRWGRLTHARVLGILKNPGYAGAYVFGRYASHRTVDPSGTVHTAMAERPRAEWPVLIKDHHEGYITWTEYLASEARLAANHTASGARPPREGTALCQGIIVCGSCGKPMMTNYHTDQRPSYECSSRRDRLTTPSCRTVVAACVDDAVAGALLDALTPGQIVLALSAADEVSAAASA
jgi:hypothetical protein